MSTAAQFDQSQTPLPLRSDTFLGVFEAIGEDLGVNPNWLRVPFAALILWNPEVIIGSYLALGAVVALTRWFFPKQAKSSAKAADIASAEPEHRAIEERMAA